ncbi:MAG: hypothetical protein GDA43_25295 [Hormoscilla sp. SP5CHS1]|nr:hypothetical protein [Hormoscilla sp. SP12CHS1]MBC6456086.1 hypothetical protein [Hormoscilla sp. SP5CHS1]
MVNPSTVGDRHQITAHAMNTKLVKILEELGILECDRGFDSFARQGLLN